jgi:serine/threonine protein phosphatase PrpC
LKSRPALHAFGVCDGHGKSGRESSNFVKFAIPIAIEEGMGDYDPDSDEKVTSLLTEAFVSVHEAFRDNVPDY